MKSNILSNKVIIIAGASGRIGESFVRGVFEHDGIPILADFDMSKSKKILEDLQRKYQVEVGEVIKFNALEKESIMDLIKHVSDKYGKIDVLVNTIYPPWKKGNRVFEDMDVDLFNDGVSKHLGSYFLLSQQIINYFHTQGYGNLINISSIQGAFNPKFDTYEGVVVNGIPMYSPIEYSCIKSGINALTTYLSKYLKNTNIRCNLISPGGIKSGQPERFCKQYKQYCSTKGLLEGDDIRGAFIFLASDMSKYINGQNIIIDDGWSL